MKEAWFQYVDIFETKGIEYLIVIGFFACFIPFAYYIVRPLWLKFKVKWIDE